MSMCYKKEVITSRGFSGSYRSSTVAFRCKAVTLGLLATLARSDGPDDPTYLFGPWTCSEPVARHTRRTLWES